MLVKKQENNSHKIRRKEHVRVKKKKTIRIKKEENNYVNKI